MIKKPSLKLRRMYAAMVVAKDQEYNLLFLYKIKMVDCISKVCYNLRHSTWGGGCQRNVDCTTPLWKLGSGHYAFSNNDYNNHGWKDI